MPSYDELASLVQEKFKAINKLNAKLDKAKSEKKSLMSKCNELVASYDHNKIEKLETKVTILEEANKKLTSSNNELEMIKDTQDKSYNVIKKSHVEQTQEIKELNETPDEVNKCYREFANTHEDLVKETAYCNSIALSLMKQEKG